MRRSCQMQNKVEHKQTDQFRDESVTLLTTNQIPSIEIAQVYMNSNMREDMFNRFYF